jgi:hypothetical protein
MDQIAKTLKLNEVGFAPTDADKITIGVICGDDRMKRSLIDALLLTAYLKGRVDCHNRFAAARKEKGNGRV